MIPIRRIAVFRFVTAVGFVLAGVNHFLKPEFYGRLIPPGFPAPAGLVWVSGVAEIVGGLGLLLPRLRRAAGWGLVALLVCVFPANVYMATHPEDFSDLGWPAWVYWARLPLQGVMVAWVWAVSRRNHSESDNLKRRAG